MPFKSKKQMRYLYANEPKIAKKWSAEFPNQDIKKLPERKGIVKSKNKL